MPNYAVDEAKLLNDQGSGEERRLTTKRSSPALSLGRPASTMKAEFCPNPVWLTKGPPVLPLLSRLLPLLLLEVYPKPASRARKQTGLLHYYLDYRHMPVSTSTAEKWL